MASPRPAATEMQSLHVEFGLPIEPRPYNCRDRALEVVGSIDDEFDDLPYANEQFDNDPTAKLDIMCTVSAVYIEDFFTDGRDFAYYVIGPPNTTTFCGGMFGMQVYDGPLFASPIISHGREILTGTHVRDIYGGKVLRSHSPMEIVKWKYLFETARLAWTKLLIDPLKVAKIRARNMTRMQQRSKAISRDPSAEWEVHSVTSPEALETEVGMSAKRRGKMMLPTLEEPSTPAASSRQPTSEPHDMVATYVGDEDLESERDRIRHNIEAIKRGSSSFDNFVECFKKEIYGWSESSDQDDKIVLTAEGDNLIEQLKDNIILELEMEEVKEDSNAENAVDLLEVEETLRSGKEELITLFVNYTRRQQGLDPGETSEGAQAIDPANAQLPPSRENLTKDQLAALDQLTSITGRSVARSILLLVECTWNVQSAVTAHFDDVHPAAGFKDPELQDDRDLAIALLASSEGIPKDEYFSTGASDKSGNKPVQPKSKAPIPGKSRSSGYNIKAGPSSKREEPLLDPTEEAKELAAARERLDLLIEFDDDDVDLLCQTGSDVRDLIESEAEMEVIRNRLDKLNQDVRIGQYTSMTGLSSDEGSQSASSDEGESVQKSIEKGKTHGTLPVKRTSFQAALDIIGASPTKKACDTSSFTTINAKDTNQVGYNRAGAPAPKQLRPLKYGVGITKAIPPRQNPDREDTLSPMSPRATPSERSREFDKKLAGLEDMGFKDIKRNYTILFECAGNLNRAVEVLSSPANSPASTKPETSKEIKSQLAILEDMGFPDAQRNAAVLKKYKGDLDRAVEALVAIAEEGDAMQVDSQPKEDKQEKGKQPQSQQQKGKENECGMRDVLASCREQWLKDRRKVDVDRRDSAQDNRRRSRDQSSHGRKGSEGDMSVVEEEKDEEMKDKDEDDDDATIGSGFL